MSVSGVYYFDVYRFYIKKCEKMQYLLFGVRTGMIRKTGRKKKEKVGFHRTLCPDEAFDPAVVSGGPASKNDCNMSLHEGHIFSTGRVPACFFCLSDKE